MSEVLIKAVNEDVERIISFLKPHVQDCIYMYIDIVKYGVEESFMDVWYSERDQEISLVVMRYHTSLTLFTTSCIEDYSFVNKIMEQYPIYSMTLRRDFAEKIFEVCKDEYEITYGYVFALDKYREYGYDKSKIELATVEDCFEIAKLILTDEGIGGYYEISDFANQLKERMETKMGRNFVIRDNGKIIAHIASYAEYAGIATTSGLIVDSNYQSGLYGVILEEHLVHELMRDEYEVYTYINDRLRKKLLERMGNECVGEYAKLAKKG